MARVIFERPDRDDLFENGITAIDMHYHTEHSDSYTRVRDAVRLAERMGIGFAVTDHNVVSGAVEAAGIETSVPIIPGIEISAWDGPHILAYFYDVSDLVGYWNENIRGQLHRSPYLAIKMSTERILDSLENENCVISAAHPAGYTGFNKGMQKCADRGYLDPRAVGRVDAYEVICGGMGRRGNEAAIRAADRSGLGYTGGSDGHMLKDMGGVVTCSDAPDTDGFLESIKKQTNFVVGLERPMSRKIGTGLTAMTRYLGYIPSSLSVHCRQNAVRARRFFSRGR